MRKPLLEERLISKVKKLENGCWEWQGAKHKAGYGLIMAWGKRGFLAHRASYILARGDIPDGLQLDHLCRNRCCVNPDHLEPVTGKENVLRGEAPSAQNLRRTHCKNGHEFNDSSRETNRSRRCAICAKAWHREYRTKHPEKFHGYEMKRKLVHPNRHRLIPSRRKRPV